MKRLATLLVIVAVLASFVAACASPAPEVVEKQVTVEVTREVPVTEVVERQVTVEVTREVPVTEVVEKEVTVEVTREVPVTEVVAKQITVEVTREVPITVEVTTVVEVTPEPVASATEVTIPLSEMKTIYSVEADRDYTLYIALPASYFRSTSMTYPVIYLLDGNFLFPEASGIVRLHSWALSAPDVIVVGIGYGIGYGGDMDELYGLREIDLTPPGAERYLDFIQESVIPYVEDNYRARPTDRTLMGHSHGGLFTLYALFHAPETFNRYVASSPSLDWDARVAFEYEEEFARDHSELPVKLFLSVGGLERVSNLEKFHANLVSRNYDGLEMEMVIMEDETHVSVLPGAYSTGLRTVFR